MAGETIETTITVDAKQAISELAKFDAETKAAEQALRDADAATKAFEKSQRDAVAAVNAIDQRIAKYERDIVALATAMASGQGNTKAYEAEMRQLSRELDTLNGRTSSAKTKTQEFAKAADQVQSSGRSSGMAVLEFSRAFEDAQYGISGVLNNIPGLLAALGIGAGLTGVVSAAAVGVSILAKNFGSVDPAAKNATDTAKTYVDDLRKEISGLSEELTKLQGTATRVAMEEQGKRIGIAAKEAQAMIDAIGGRERLDLLETATQGGARMDLLQSRTEYMARDIVYRTRNPFVSPEMLKQAIEAREKLDLEMSKLAAMKRIEQEQEDQKQIDAAIENANEQTRREQDIRDKAREDEKKAQEREQKELAEMRRKWVQQLYDDDDKLAKDAEERRKREAKERGQELKDAFAYYDEQFKAAEKAEKDRTALEQKEAEKRAKIAEAEQKAKIEGLTSSATAAAAAVGVFAAQSAMGQEEALAQLLSTAAEAAGGQIILKGSEVIAGGIAGMLAAPNPASAAQIAGGLGLVAAGAAVQTGGPSAVNALLGMAGVSGGGGSSDRAGATDRGASPRSSRGRGGEGGPTVINISYGVGGPLPEDTAREVARVMKTGNRRRGAA